MDDKVKKIWYLIIIILVCLSAIFYIFKSNLSKKVQPVEIPKTQETTITEPKQDVETKQEEVKVEKNVNEDASQKKKQEAKTTISNAGKQVKEAEPKTEPTPQQEEKAVKEMQQIQETAQPSNRSEVVEIRYMYKTNLNNNVYYRGVWYNIKTKTLDENGNEVTTETKTATDVNTETESME